MNNQIETFINYLLDTETTSEISFIENDHKKNELFQLHYIKDWEHMVLRKLQQVHRNGITSTLNNVDSSQKSESEISSEVSTASSSEDDEEEDEDNTNKKSIQNEHTHHSSKTTHIYVNIVHQCQRLLRILYYCQQHYVHFNELYFFAIEQCLKSDNDKIVTIVLKQIASHIFEGISNDNESQRLIRDLPLDTLSSIISSLHQPMLTIIQTLLSKNKMEIYTTNFLANHIDILYPCTSHFLDVRREFRDSTHYLIDGDSLILSIAHHININLNLNYGNTLHVIFIIERILLTFFYQSNQCNYTLIFFDCHYHLYQQENSILSLIRSCLIIHLSKNIDKYRTVRLQQFSSWLSNEYLKFIQEEKPMFLFYHDMSTFNKENDKLLSKDILEKLFYTYRLFGNYHQYVVQCQLYLMNKLILTETTVQCFQIQFNRMYPKQLLNELVKTVSSDLNIMNNIQERDWNKFEILCQDISENDIRLFLYLKTIVDFIEENIHERFVQFFSPLLILHVALLIRLSLIDRHLPSSIPSIIYSSTFSQYIIQFQQRLSSNLFASNVSSLSYSKIADLFDGRLFTFTLYQIYQSSKISLDSKTYVIVKQSLDLLNIPSNENIFQDIVKELIHSNDIFFSSLLSTNQSTIIQQQNRQKIVRISNPFVDAYLKPIFSSNDTLTFDMIRPDDNYIIQYKDKHYWQTYKEVGNEIDRIRDKNIKKNGTQDYRYRTRNQQKLYDYFTLYGKSLTTRDVRDSQSQIVLPVASTPLLSNKENCIDQTDSVASSGNKKKQQHKNQPKKVLPTKAEMIIEKNKQRILDKRINDETDKVINVETRLKQISSDNYSDAIDLIDECLPSFETSMKRLELLKKKLDLQRKYLRILKKKNLLTLEEKSKLELLQIGFFATLCEITHLENLVDAFNEKKKFMEELIDDLPLDTEKWYRFQFEKINSRLPRREQGIRDERISDFIPDPWQVKFLDGVDKQQSIIIVASTASGKTYASYYAMGKVLKDKDDTNGICVYIAPTKALINQVAGTIHSKFGPVFGTFTRDYEMNMEKCRILVTIPECLEMLLLSPKHQQWCQRIRYCIFDEIHCMSADIGSDVWERTMLLINCPMIGLSATVNNGENLQHWIEHVEKQRSILFKTSIPRPVCFISHLERLADLNKYLYSNRQLHPLHPIGLMNSKQLTSRGLPQDLSLSPCETLRLNEAMQKTNVKNNQIPTLTEYFSPNWIVERNMCNTYSRLVCNQFNDLIQNNENSIIDSISSSLNPITSNKINYPEIKPMSSLIGEFVLTLKEKNLLPCIVFTDSRSLCEELAENVAQYFEELENELRRTKYKYQIEAIEKRLIQIEKAQKTAKAKKIVKSSKKRGDDEEEEDDKPVDLQQMEEEDQSYLRLSGYEQDLLNGILEEGTLANQRTCDRELVDRLMERVASVNPRLVRYIKRGVAYHHPQLNNKGRLAVEGLFRNRYVQIIFSTWTLALGIHMPTKTVAFVKDSIQLDALQYRQSSGRAGRRGFDVQGNIVFLDIPMSKIRHLTIAAIPNIQTHITTSVTFLMRLLYLYSNAEDKKDAINRSLIALQCPFNAQTSMTHHLIDIQTRYHCLHTLDFLYRLNLINHQGDLIGLAGFLTELHHFEPANILFGYLMDTKLFHELNDDEQIINLLAYLFTNRPWLMIRQQVNNSLSVKDKLLFNSKFSLQSISSEIHQRIQTYNALVKEIYGFYIENVLKKMRSFNDYQEYILPFSNISFNQSSDYDNGTFEYNLHHHYSQQSQNPSISPFAGPSGLTHEQFMSNYNPTIGSWDLAYNIDLSTRIVPYVDIDARDHTNSAYYLNSYALDFFRHGSEKLLMSENELDRSETYHLLSDFFLSLTSIKTSLHTIMENEIKHIDNNDVKFFNVLNKNLSNIQDQFSSMTDELELLNYDDADEVSRKEDKNTNTGVTSVENETLIGTESETIRGSSVSIHFNCFKDFHFKPELLRAIMYRGFEHPSEVQRECIPQAILGTDIVCQAKSGMGKTAVFILATLQQLEPVDGQVSVIVLCHTSELAFQISREYEYFCKYLPTIKVSVFFGGLSIRNDEDVLKKNCPHIVVGTIGRILALAKSKALNLRYVKHFIIDECDKVLGSRDMRRDVQEIFKMTPQEKQVLMFSATLSKEIRPVCKKLMQEPMEIYIDNETQLILHGLRQHYIKLCENEKSQKLMNLLDKLEFNQVVIFVKSLPRCTALCKFLIEQSFPAVEIHRGMPQQERLACYKKFKDFQTRILVTTNLFERGIDIERINIVFNYDMPENSDTYLHRVSRTGRFGTKGLAITYVANESDAAILNEVQNRFQVQITEMPDEIDVATYIENR
ncbi:unnamed protein product [Rotaria sordida]|uniref:RNA helicase n=1 Tax=Rotaria sordida TaxID=392033 RepID=A0A818INJ8_9BILA|nr:unnamed protein product [Rotaria sordida]